jgi:hypothetical protein
LLVTLAIVTALLGAASPASAADSAPFSDTDPIGDTSYPRGDIDRVRVAYSIGAQVRLDVGTRVATRFSSPVWNDHAGRTQIRWTIYGNGPGNDFQVRLRGTNGGPVARLFELDGDPVSCSLLTSYLAARRIRITFDSTCLPASVAVRVNVTYRFNPLGSAPADVDRYPATGSTGPFLPSCPHAPTGGEGC